MSHESKVDSLVHVAIHKQTFCMIATHYHNLASYTDFV